MVNDETFFAWLDGELDSHEAARVEAEVARDPELSAMAAEHRALRTDLRAAFDPVLDARVPDALLATVRNPPAAEVIDLAAARERRESHRGPTTWQWAAMAATLALGVLVGTIVPHQRGTGPVQVEGHSMYAATALSHALDTQLASAPSGDTRIGVTFRDHAGAICRSFTSSASSGLACRENGRWQMRGLFGAPEGAAADYRMAAGMDPSLAALVESAMAGEPFDAAAEKATRANNWR